MRQGSNTGRRPRGRTNRKQHGGGGGGGQSRTHTFDSNGPDGRVRGNARQVYEKYVSLARDATSAGDRVAAEAYFQHAEHYFRILSDTTDPTPRRPQEERQPQQAYSHDDGDYGDDDDQPVNGHSGERQSEARSNGNTAGRMAPASRAHASRATTAPAMASLVTASLVTASPATVSPGSASLRAVRPSISPRMASPGTASQ